MTSQGNRKTKYADEKRNMDAPKESRPRGSTKWQYHPAQSVPHFVP